MDRSGDGQFPTTHWTVISRLRSGSESESRRALDDLCAQYHYPLYCYLRRHGLEHEDAQDALHDFLAKLLRLDALKDADRDKGRLRSFLATALRRYLINWSRDHSHRHREVSLDAELAASEGRYQREQFSDHDTPDRIFERKWAQELLMGVLRRLGTLYKNNGKDAIYKTLRPVLMTGGSLRDGDAAQLAASLSVSEGNLRVVLNRLLQDYCGLLRDEVRQTVEHGGDVNDEIRHLQSVFTRDA